MLVLVFILLAICGSLTAAMNDGCPHGLSDCYRSKKCQWSPDLNKCVSSLPCALEASEDDCVTNTWGCEWLSDGKCTTQNKPAGKSVVSCSLNPTEQDCKLNLKCFWHRDECKRRPTIVMSLADDLSYYDVSWRNPRIRTPVIERLRNGGMELERYYTARFCAPTRAMLLTGRYAWRLGLQTDLNLNPPHALRCGVNKSNTLLPEYLKLWGGYATHAFGKWHLGQHRDDYLPTSRGFDTYVGWLSGGLDNNLKPKMFLSERCACLGKPVGFCNPYNKKTKLSCTLGTDMIRTTALGEYSPVYAEDVSEDTTDLYVANRVRDVIRSTDANDPLFLYIAWATPHTRVQAPDRYRLSRRGSTPQMGIDSILIRKCGLPQREAHLAMLGVLDEAHRIVLDALDAASRFDSTIFVFSSDNGGNTPRRDIKKPQKLTCNTGSNYPLRGSKFTWFEGGIRSVAFITSPDYLHESRKGTNHSGLVSANDFLQTLISAAGIQTPEGELTSDSLDLWNSLSSIGSSTRTNRTELPLQAWLEEEKYVMIYYHEEKLHKLIQGYPWSGTGAGTRGKPMKGYSNSDIFQPWELPRRELKYRLSNGMKSTYDCKPTCLFDVESDPQEFVDLSPVKNVALQTGYSLVQKYRNMVTKVDATGLCEPGFYSKRDMDTTDQGSVAYARLCRAYIPWLFTNNTVKPLNAPCTAGEPLDAFETDSNSII